jgi:hypothetical protein
VDTFLLHLPLHLLPSRFPNSPLGIRELPKGSVRILGLGGIWSNPSHPPTLLLPHLPLGIGGLPEGTLRVLGVGCVGLQQLLPLDGVLDSSLVGRSGLRQVL